MNISIVGQNAEHSLKKHLLNKSNPHGITIDTIGAARVEHNHTSNQLTTEDGTNLLQFFSNEIGSIFSSSKAYTDEKIAALVNSAPETLDTLGELATAFNENKNVTDVLNAAITNKADKEHTHTKLDNGYVLEWHGDRLLRSTDRPNTNLHFGADVLYRYHSPSGVYYGIYDEGHKPTPTEIGAATLGGHNEYFFGIHLGTTQDALPYIYSENENINFRYKDSKSGAMQYTSVNDIMYSIGSKASSDHSHTTIKDSGDGRNITFNYSADGLPSASWLAAWNGAELRAISPSSMRTTIGAAAANHTHTYSDVGAAAASHTHNITLVAQDSSILYGRSGLQYFNQSLTTSGSSTANYAPTSDWWHVIRMNHANTQGYYVDLGVCFHANNLQYRRVSAGTDNGWVRVHDNNNLKFTLEGSTLKITTT